MTKNIHMWAKKAYSHWSNWTYFKKIKQNKATELSFQINTLLTCTSVSWIVIIKRKTRPESWYELRTFVSHTPSWEPTSTYILFGLPLGLSWVVQLSLVNWEEVDLGVRGSPGEMGTNTWRFGIILLERFCEP